MSKYVRITQDEYEVQGLYRHGPGWECVTTETNLREARERAREYRENERGIFFRIQKKRVPLVAG